MGNVTRESRDFLLYHHDQRAMQGVVWVKSPTNNSFFYKRVSYGGGNDVSHIEQKMMSELNTRFPGFASIPNNSTIIFSAKWSPCKQCATVLIPDFLRLLNLRERPLRVKFRFESYYTRATWESAGHAVRASEIGGGSFFWANQQEADAAYRRLVGQYGVYSSSPQTVADALTVKIKNKLVIAAAGNERTSITETFNDSDFMDD